MRNLNISRTNIIIAVLCIALAYVSLSKFSSKSVVVLNSQSTPAFDSDETTGLKKSYTSQASNLRSTLNGGDEPASEECVNFLNKIRALFKIFPEKFYFT